MGIRASAPQILSALVDAETKRETIALVTVTEADGLLADQLGSHAIVWLDQQRSPLVTGDLGALIEEVTIDARRALRDRRHLTRRYRTESGTICVFVEVRTQPAHLIIAGAGHIAVPLAAIAGICDFEVTVLDDRPQYASPQRFPNADHVVAGPFRAELRRLRGDRTTFDEHTYFVLVTRGHQHDVDCLLEVLDDPVAYIGMIGSRRRIQAVYNMLESEQGIPAVKFDRIYAPIGLDIGAQTPAEIAVCIMAEIVNVQRGGPALSLSRQIRQERAQRRQRIKNTKSSLPLP